MYETRYYRDDIIPMLRDAGIATTLTPWLKYNVSEEFLRELVQMEHGIIILSSQLRSLVSDLKEVGALEGADVESLPLPIIRPAVPTGIGCAGGNVWVTPPGETYILRFYVNGIHKLTMNDYYITSLESIGAVAGDVVQVGIVALEGTVGWWARITVT